MNQFKNIYLKAINFGLGGTIPSKLSTNIKQEVMNATMIQNLIGSLYVAMVTTSLIHHDQKSISK